MKPIDLFSEKDKKIRKRWRTALFVMAGFEILSTLFVTLGDETPVSLFVGIALFIIVVYGVLYYLTYYRQSAHFLMAFLIVPLTHLPKRIEALKSNLETAEPGEVKYILIFLGITLALFSWWYFASFQIYQIHLGFRPSWGCRRAIKKMKKLEREQLQTKYEELLSQYPRYKPAIELAYHNTVAH
jgi:hypothetical protein